jgi:hypothetical protein
MSIDPHDRRAILNALIEYARESRTLNPHFYSKDMMKRMGLTRGR